MDAWLRGFAGFGVVVLLVTFGGDCVACCVISWLIRGVRVVVIWRVVCVRAWVCSGCLCFNIG